MHDLVDECIECGFCESVCPSRDLTFTPRQRIAALRELESARDGLPGCLDSSLASLEETMEYAGKDTCAGDSMCATKCPVGIDTGALVKDLRNASLSPAELRVGAYLAKHMAWAMSSARRLLVRYFSCWVGEYADAKIECSGGRPLCPWCAVARSCQQNPQQHGWCSRSTTSSVAGLPSCEFHLREGLEGLLGRETSRCRAGIPPHLQHKVHGRDRREWDNFDNSSDFVLIQEGQHSSGDVTRLRWTVLWFGVGEPRHARAR